MPLTLRNSKGSPLTNTEIDNNFLFLESASNINFDNDGTGLFSEKVQDAIVEVNQKISQQASIARLQIVNSLSDLPDAVGGVITLAPNIEYFFASDIDFGTTRIETSAANVISGQGQPVTTLNYSGTGSFITTPIGSSVVVREFLVNCANGTFFESVQSGFAWSNITVVECERIASIDATAGYFIEKCQFLNVKTNGIEYYNSLAAGAVQACIAIVGAGGAFLDFGTSTLAAFTCINSVITLDPTAHLVSGLANSGNIVAGGIATIANSRIDGNNSPLDGVTDCDTRWQFALNDDIADTRPDLMIYGDNLPQTTSISSSDTPEKVNANYAMQTECQFSFQSDGRFTYDGQKDARLPITVSISMSASSGNNRVISAYLYKNGSQVAASKTTETVTTDRPQSLTLVWQDNFQSADYYEVFVENNTNSTDIEVEDIKVRVN